MSTCTFYVLAIHPCAMLTDVSCLTAHNPKEAPNQTSYWKILKTVKQKEGVKGLYKGELAHCSIHPTTIADIHRKRHPCQSFSRRSSLGNRADRIRTPPNTTKSSTVSRSWSSSSIRVASSHDTHHASIRDPSYSNISSPSFNTDNFATIKPTSAFNCR